MTTSEEEWEKMGRIRKEVVEAGPAILPGLFTALEADMHAAMNFDPHEPPFQDIYTSRIQARHQVKAILAMAWFKRREAVPLLAKFLDGPSMTARSQAAGAIEAITGEKVPEDRNFVVGDTAWGQAVIWWRDNRSRFLGDDPLRPTPRGQ